MSIEKAKAYLRQFGAEDRVIEFPVSSATVELAVFLASKHEHVHLLPDARRNVGLANSV